MDYSDLRINSQRYKADFNALSKFGETPTGGVNRPAFSESHLAARAWFRERILESGLELHVDGASNHSAILKCPNDDAPTLLLGSHLDSVPDGGRFDGALGVIAALEVLRSVKFAGINLPFHLEAIDFTDEEGTLLGDLGSAALSGSLKQDDLARIPGFAERLHAAFMVSGLDVDGLCSARRAPDTLVAYLELHIEQGSRLSTAGIPIGIVTDIVGIGAYQISFKGRADHSGTTSMSDRLDAAQGAAAYILSVREKVLKEHPDSVANVVWQRTLPGAMNVVPQLTELGLEFRSPEPESLAALEKSLISLAEDEAQRWGLGLEIKHLSSHLPVSTSPKIQQVIHDAAQELGFATLSLVSGAWHDAQMLAPVCPSGMIFIPSEHGSHSPREFASWGDCVNGANVLLQSTLRLAHLSF